MKYLKILGLIYCNIILISQVYAEKNIITPKNNQIIYKEEKREKFKIKSIQGREYENRINGIFDLSITDQDIQDFLDSAKKAILTNEPNIIANIFSFPMRLNSDKEKIIINSKKDFIINYNQIVTETIIELILKADINELFVNYQGFMIGDGEIWFNPYDGIITINIINKK